MNSYSNLTSDQLAEWHQQTARVTRLNELLLAEQNKVHLLEAEVRNLTEARALMEADFRADFDRLAGAVRDQADKAMRANNKLHVLAECVPDFLLDFIATYEPFEDVALTKETQAMRRNARELMVLLGASPT